MSKQMEIPTPVKICGLAQNVYVRDSVRSTPVTPSGTIEKYPSLEKKQFHNGYAEVLELKDYPINAHSVASYADSANYRNDPAQAVANQPKRVNLGDITEVQDFIAHNPQQAVLKYRQILERVSQVLPELEKISKAVEETQQSESEVKE